MLEAFFTRINQSNIVKKKKEQNVEVEREYLEDFDEERVVWKKVFSLLCEPVWYNLIIFFGWYSSMIAFVDVAFAINNEHTKREKSAIFYLCDSCMFIDIVLRTTAAYVNLSIDLISPPPKHWILICIDYISIFPVELFLKNDKFVYNLAALNRPLKIFHAIYFFNHLNFMVNESISRHVIQLLYFMSYFTFFTSTCVLGITCSINPEFCNFKDNDEGAFYRIIFLLKTVGGHLLTTGFGLIYYQPSRSKTFAVVTNFLIFLGAFFVYTANISYAFLINASHKSNFRYKLNGVCKLFRKKGDDQNLIRLLKDYFDNMWSICDGYEGYMAEVRTTYGFESIKHLLPKSINMEIFTDICWAAYGHSKLFSQMDIAFLREISCVIKQQVYIGGQYVYHKNEIKDKMIYVLVGTIQVISPEDQETSLLSLGVGTILGESSIVIPYKSKFAVKCSTTCILQVLERKQFLKLALKYPSDLKFIVDDIMKRYRDAITLHEVKKVVNNKPRDLFKRSLSTLWINYTLHKLMGCKDRDSAYTHAVQNIYLQDNITDDNFKNYLFDANYLSMLAITERVELNSDTLFIKSHFPHIIKPNTGLVLFFDIAMGLLSIMSTFLITRIMISEVNSGLIIHSTVYTFTGLWVLDILIKLSTAVRLPHRTLTKRMKILIYRLSEATFLLDIFCAWPVEIHSAILVRKEAANLVYLNRTVKIYKVFQLLYWWEKRYNSNYLLVRTMGIAVLLFYGIMISSTVFSFMVCADICTNHQRLEIVFFATQIITGVSLYVPEYSELSQFYGMDIILFFFVCVSFSVLYGLMLSAYVFSELNNISIRYHTLLLLKMVKHLHSYTLIRRVEREAALQIKSSDGVNIMSPNFIFQIIPIPAIGHFFKTMYLDWICLLPLFKDVPTHITLDILQTCAILENLESNVFIYHVGDLLDDFIILANGECESVSGVSYSYHHVGSRTALNDFEVALGIASRNTINTKTDCDIIRIPYLEMRKVFLKYDPKKYKIRRMEDFKYQAKAMKNVSPNIICFRYLYDEKEKSTVNYSIGDNQSVYTENIHSCFRKLLLSITFLPTGKFFQRWEFARSVFAITSSLLYSTTSLSTLPFPHPVAFVLLFLDITAYIDLYIQAHVCYYNEKGIFITDPLLTLNNYISSRFWIDAIAAFPLHYLIKKRKYILLNITKLLQLYRYVGFIHHKVYRSVTPSSKFYMFKNIPVLLIIINLYASIFLIWNCNLDDPKNPKAVHCSHRSVFVKNEFNETWTPLTAHIYSFYIAFSTISTISIQGFSIHDEISMIFLGFLSCCGVYWATLSTASIFKYYLYDHVRTGIYDIKVKRLYKFMETEKIRKTLVSKVDKHLTCCNFLEPYNAHKYIQKFSSRIKRDILFERFGKTLSKICLKFGADVDQFLRNILIHSEYLIIDKNGYAQTINDVTDEVSIIFTGIIDIVAPNGEIMMQLAPGCLFGNLCNMKYNRMKISAVAKGTLEILKIKSLKFFEILQHFNSTSEQFYKLREIHATHIPGYSQFIYPTYVENTDLIFKSKSKIFFTLEMLFLLMGAYFGVINYLYQVSVHEFGLNFVIIDVVCDICFALLIIIDIKNPMYTKVHSFKNIKGFVFGKNMIFWFSIITCIPTEIIVYWSSVSPAVKWYLFLVLKAIVLFRFKTLFLKYDEIYRTSTTNIFLCKFIFSLLIVLFIMIGICTMMITLCKYLKINLSGYTHPDTASDSIYRFESFAIWMLVVSNIFMRCSQIRYFPCDILLLVIINVLLILIVLFSTAVFANINSMMESTKGPKRKFVRRLRHLCSIVKNLETSLSMAERVSYYVEVIWFQFYGMIYPDLLHEFPLYLKEAILQNAFGQSIDTHPVFGKCHIDFKRQLHNYLRINYYNNGDYIQFKGIVDNTMYWVHFGEVVALSEASDYSNDIIETYKKGASFGIPQGLFDNSTYYFSYRAVTFTCILYLVKEDWEHLMPFFPASAETIKVMGMECFMKEKTFIEELLNEDD